MDGIRTRDDAGKQRPDYYKPYYLKNKERIAAQFKERYERIKADPLLLKEHRERCAEATRRYRQRHPDRTKPQRRKGYLNRRIKAFGILGGAFCVHCGCDVLEFLEVNHKNGGGCKEYRRLGNSIFERINGGELNPEKYNVLCRVCNALDHLQRKNSEKAARYQVKFTSKKAELIK